MTAITPRHNESKARAHSTARTIRLTFISRRLSLFGVSIEFLTSFVSAPVKQAIPMAHSVFLSTAPLSNMFSASNGKSTLGSSGPFGGVVNFPVKVLTDALGCSDTKTDTYFVPSPCKGAFCNLLALNIILILWSPFGWAAGLKGEPFLGFSLALIPKGYPSTVNLATRTVASSRVSTCAVTAFREAFKVSIFGTSSFSTGKPLFLNFKFVSPSMELVST
mmetsp:Transcript_24309/g.29902  ORF Transcript_24309/g.29902 Transcript_24309/m.29902 type:complete len:220 (+) Transcript_24309:3820-4479(+)